MARHKEMYVVSSHTKKIFANMRRIRAGFSGVVTPLFETIMVQAAADMGDTPVETHQTPIVDQPSTSRPQKKQKPRRKQTKEAEVSHDELEDEDHVPIPSGDSLPSEAMYAQSKEIVTLKKKVSKLLKWRKLRSRGLRRLMKIGLGRRVKSPSEKDSLGAQEDASKQERMTEEIDQDDKIALDAKTQRRTNDDEMFRVNDLSGDEVVTTVADKVSPAPTTYVTEDEITMAQALVALKSVKPKDKGKAKLIEPEVPIKKKDQIRMDEKYARQLEAEEHEAARPSRAQHDEEANIS
uniref:Uncharacterized protein n=1 Tax=Tanacetum cinerariifolium TaxID=118510 RepID=A0A6L2NMI3_TANCI|nr:hypothetical protein [Tanacetum cinerariifolium]